MNTKYYTVDTLVTLNISINVEANNQKEAKEKAFQEATDSPHYGETLWNVRVDSIEKDD